MRRVLYGLMAAYCGLLLLDHWADITTIEPQVVEMNVLTGLVDSFFVVVGLTEALIPEKFLSGKSSEQEDFFVRWTFFAYVVVNYANHTALFFQGEEATVAWLILEMVAIVALLRINLKKSPGGECRPTTTETP